MANLAHDPIATLKAAGVLVDQIPAEKLEVLADLSPEEVTMLIDVHNRLSSPDEVQAYGPPGHGGIIF